MRLNVITGSLLSILLTSLVLQTVLATDEPAELKQEEVKILDILENETAYHGKMVVLQFQINIPISHRPYQQQSHQPFYPFCTSI